MQQDKIVTEVLTKFQWHYRRFDVCRLRFSDLFKLLDLSQQEVLLNICELDKSKLDELDDQIPARSLLVNPYRFSTFARRFVRVTPELWDSFQRMSVELAKYNGKKLRIISGYRSPAYQSLLYLKALYRNNFDESKTKKIIGLPGRSEHQDYKRLAVDIADIKSSRTLSESSYNWLNKNAKKYNFTNSYPKNNNKDGINFEPWHWRFFL